MDGEPRPLNKWSTIMGVIWLVLPPLSYVTWNTVTKDVRYMLRHKDEVGEVRRQVRDGSDAVYWLVLIRNSGGREKVVFKGEDGVVAGEMDCSLSNEDYLPGVSLSKGIDNGILIPEGEELICLGGPGCPQPVAFDMKTGKQRLKPLSVLTEQEVFGVQKRVMDRGVLYALVAAVCAIAYKYRPKQTLERLAQGIQKAL